MFFKDTKITVSDAVTTLFYASVVNVVLYYSVSSIKINSFFIALALILFIFVDWISRTYIPLTFSVTGDQTKRKNIIIQFSKSTIEIIAVYCLLVFSVYCLKNEPVSSENIYKNSAFCGFLFMSFIWNIIVLDVMNDLSWKQLIIHGIKGSVFDLSGVEKYTIKFHDKVKTLETQISNSKSLGSTLQSSIKLLLFGWIAGSGRMLAQLLAHHIAWITPFIAILILSSRDNNNLLRYIEWVENNIWFGRWGFLFLAFIIPILLYFISYIILKIWDGQRKKAENRLKLCAGILSIILLIAFYITLDAEIIIIFMLAQQFLVGIVIIVSTPDTNLSIVS